MVNVLFCHNQIMTHVKWEMLKHTKSEDFFLQRKFMNFLFYLL